MNGFQWLDPAKLPHTGPVPVDASLHEVLLLLDGDGDGEGDVVTSVYSVNGQTTLLIVKPAPSTTASATETGYTKSSASRRTAIVSTAAATTATEQASDAARRFQTPPIGNGDMAFGVGLGVFVFLGVVRMLLD